MKFESVKCDECGRIQDGANHWLQVAIKRNESPGDPLIAIVLGDLELVCGGADELHDLCGQGCAMKHIAKLLGWSAPTTEAA
jgi:hypothetical protein